MGAMRFALVEYIFHFPLEPEKYTPPVPTSLGGVYCPGEGRVYLKGRDSSSRADFAAPTPDARAQSAKRFATVTARQWEEDNSTDPPQNFFRDLFFQDFCEGFSRQDLAR